MPTFSFSGPVHTTPFLYKNGEKNLRFCESVHTDPHKNATKTEVFENAFDQCERKKTEVFENAPISNDELHKNGDAQTHKNKSVFVNAQKRMFFAAFLLSGRSV